MATAASRENEENTATGGQRTLDGNVLPAVNELHQGSSKAIGSGAAGAA